MATTAAPAAMPAAADGVHKQASSSSAVPADKMSATGEGPCSSRPSSSSICLCCCSVHSVYTCDITTACLTVSCYITSCLYCACSHCVPSSPGPLAQRLSASHAGAQGSRPPGGCHRRYRHLLQQQRQRQCACRGGGPGSSRRRRGAAAGVCWLGCHSNALCDGVNYQTVCALTGACTAYTDIALLRLQPGIATVPNPPLPTRAALHPIHSSRLPLPQRPIPLPPPTALPHSWPRPAA